MEKANIPFDNTDMPVDEFWGRLGRITDGNEYLCSEQYASS